MRCAFGAKKQFREDKDGCQITTLHELISNFIAIEQWEKMPIKPNYVTAIIVGILLDKYLATLESVK